MSKAEFASVSEYTPPFQYEMPVRPETRSVSDTPPSEGVSRAGPPSQREDLPRAETAKSESSLGSDESSTPEEPSTPEACPGLQAPSNPELPSVPVVEAKSKYFLDELSQEALLGEEAFPQEEEPQLMPLELFPGLHDPFAEVEAKLARLSSTVALADAPQADVPKVPMQVADAEQDARREFGRWSSAGRGRSPGAQGWTAPAAAPAPTHHLGGGSGPWPAQGTPVQGSGRDKLCVVLCKWVGKLGSRYKAMPGGHLLR